METWEEKYSKSTVPSLGDQSCLFLTARGSECCEIRTTNSILKQLLDVSWTHLCSHISTKLTKIKEETIRSPCIPPKLNQTQKQGLKFDTAGTCNISRKNESLREKYLKLEKIASGTFADVYKGRGFPS